MTSIEKKPIEEDHRVRVAREKRQRTLRKLLDATQEVLAKSGEMSSTVVEDIMRTANVSRGTFYNYFKSVDEAANALGNELSAELWASLGGIRQHVEDPVRQTAIAGALFMMHAAMDSAWGLCILRWGYLADPNVAEEMSSSYLRAHESGDFRVEDPMAAYDFISGALLGAIRRISKGLPDVEKYIADIMRMVLTGLGASERKAASATDFAFEYLHEHGPKLKWWRPLQSEPKKAARGRKG